MQSAKITVSSWSENVIVDRRGFLPRQASREASAYLVARTITISAVFTRSFYDPREEKQRGCKLKNSKNVEDTARFSAKARMRNGETQIFT